MTKYIEKFSNSNGSFVLSGLNQSEHLETADEVKQKTNKKENESKSKKLKKKDESITKEYEITVRKLKQPKEENEYGLDEIDRPYKVSSRKDKTRPVRTEDLYDKAEDNHELLRKKKKKINKEKKVVSSYKKMIAIIIASIALALIAGGIYYLVTRYNYKKNYFQVAT